MILRDVDQLAFVAEFALGDRMGLEHFLHGLEVEFGGHVADRTIFVVEGLGRLRGWHRRRW